MQLRQDPPRFHPSHELNQLLGGMLYDQLSKPPAQTLNHILYGIWSYIKYHNLQDLNDKKTINNDETLKRVMIFYNSLLTKILKIFGSDKMTFSDILHRVKTHLVLPDPIEIDYTIR